MKKNLLYLVFMLVAVSLHAQDCSNLFISEYVEGSGNNKAIEIYNPTNNTIDLGGYQLVRYSNGGTTPNAIQLGGNIEPKSTFVVVLDKRDPNGTGNEIMVDPALQAKADTFLCPVYDVNKAMYFNGNDAMTLETLGGTEILDIVARVGNPDPENGWCAFTDTTISYNSGGVPTEYTIEDYIVGPLFWLSWTKDHTLIRKYAVKKGVTENPTVFNVAVEWDSIPENTFDNLGTHNCECNKLSVEELKEGVDINFYPNPITGETLHIDALEKIQSVTVYNMTGQIVIHQNFNGVLELAIASKSLKNGVYFVKVSFENQNNFVKKILKK
ncbi:MAG: lamin tail domain-containing protein [Bacteroidetes bacterium]|nr:lamin tail domain-containing protein [Bacteroidota bacterium]